MAGSPMCVDIELNEVLGIITVIITLIIAWYAKKISKEANNISMNQAIIDLQKDYNLNEMLNAIMELRDVYNKVFEEKCRYENKILVGKEEGVDKLFKLQIDAIIKVDLFPGIEKVQNYKIKKIRYEELVEDYMEEYTRSGKESDSLHYKRRILTHFYKRLEANKKIIGIETISKYWTTDDTLDILPLILIPIELRIWKKLIVERSQNPKKLIKKKVKNIRPLLDLYKEALKYENRKNEINKPVKYWKKINKKIEASLKKI